MYLKSSSVWHKEQSTFKELYYLSLCFYVLIQLFYIPRKILKAALSNVMTVYFFWEVKHKLVQRKDVGHGKKCICCEKNLQCSVTECSNSIECSVTCVNAEKENITLVHINIRNY